MTISSHFRALATGAACCLLCLASVLAATAQSTPEQRPVKNDATVFYDFTEHLKDPGVENPGKLTAQMKTPGGRARICLFEHPNGVGQSLARLAFNNLALPTLNPGEKLTMQVYLAISPGFDPAEVKFFDGVRFIIEVNGRRALEQDWAKQEWTEARADLTPLAGQTVSLAFLTDPMGNSANDWAIWGTPRILIEGRPAEASTAPPIARVPSLKIDALLAEPHPERLMAAQEDGSGTALVAVMDDNLDLAMALQRNESRANPAAPRSPALVVGEGEDPENHTLIQVLNRFGIADLQFLAYPPDVKGGVAVCAGELSGRGMVIVAAPLQAANTREIRLFSKAGLPLGSFAPEAKLKPPFVIAVGPFLAPQKTDNVIAVASRHCAGDGDEVIFYDGRGQAQGTLPIKGQTGDLVHLDRAGQGQLILQVGSEVRFVSGNDPAGKVVATGLPTAWRAYPSAFNDGELFAAGPEETISTLLRLRPGQAPERIDAGKRENTFWIEWYGQKDGQSVTELPDGKYVKAALYRHLRTDDRAYDMIKPDSSRLNADEYLKHFNLKHGFADYDTTTPIVYNPCFTHRQPYQLFKDNWLPAKDSAGRPAYGMLTRLNNPVEYGEFDTIGFMSSTYAYGLPALEQFYIGTLGTFLSRLAVEFRKNPDHIAALEPNHEHEVAVEADGSMGDYNTKNIEGFFHYLTRLYGGDLGQLNQRFGTSFSEFFDAPRMQERGEWDGYVDTNPFFRQWVAYNRYVVNRRIGDSFREALLAGFPPELIKSHQIPDLYAIGDLGAFSTITSRLTPIDYAMAAGVGFGFTRYGVWYKRPHDVLQAAHDSGHDSVSIGEYQALTPNAEDAYNQLNWIFEHGAAAVHCMLWPMGYDQGFNATMDQAIRRLVQNDRPRPGLAGGVSQVRTFRQGDQCYNIASLGVGPAHTGLLKSLNDKGEWTGAVYSVPFHAHVDVAAIPSPEQLVLAEEPLVLSPLDLLDSGSQVELTFEARATSATAPVAFSVAQGTQPLPGLERVITAGADWKPCRITFRVQLPVEGLELRLAAPRGMVEIRNLRAYQQTAQIAKPTRGVFSGRRHQGGVTFDLLP